MHVLYSQPDFIGNAFHARLGPISYKMTVKPLSANPTKWSNTLRQFVGRGWSLKGL